MLLRSTPSSYAQLTLKDYKSTALLMDGQQSLEHHHLLISPTDVILDLGILAGCSVMSHWLVYDAVEIAFNVAALIKKNRVEILNFQMPLSPKI